MFTVLKMKASPKGFMKTGTIILMKSVNVCTWLELQNVFNRFFSHSFLCNLSISLKVIKGNSIILNKKVFV